MPAAVSGGSIMALRDCSNSHPPPSVAAPTRPVAPVAPPQPQIAILTQRGTDRRKAVSRLINRRERQFAGSEAKLARAAVDDNVDRIEIFAASKHVGALLQSR